MPVKPAEQEEEFFARQEFARRKHALADQASRAAEEERQRILAVTQGHCPKCGAALIVVPYRGVEIDKCSHCQGVWLDCGELEQVTAGEPEEGFLSGLKRLFG